jgi:hypothetical protein
MLRERESTAPLARAQASVRLPGTAQIGGLDTVVVSDESQQAAATLGGLLRCGFQEVATPTMNGLDGLRPPACPPGERRRLAQ